MNSTKWIKFQLWWLIKFNILKHVQRRYIYRIALEEKCIKLGVCIALCKVHLENYNRRVGLDTVLIIYPEFAKQKPTTDRGYYWWPISDTESRINALKEAIKLTYKK